MTPAASPRYRIDGGKTCIDIRLSSAHRLFDSRDPAPFRERDLDEDAVEYIVGAVQELPPKTEIRIVFWIASELTSDLTGEAVCQGVRGYFEYEAEKLRRQQREQRRQGQLYLGIGLAVLTLLLVGSELALLLPPGTGREVLREGLIITGWVAMWKPLEVLLYDWRPLVRRRRLYERIAASELVVEPAGTSHAP